MALDFSGISMFLEAETDFGLSLLRHAPMNGSLVFSPLSVMFALAMVQLGSKGNTKAQIDNVLSKGASHRAIVEHYSKLSRQIMEARNGVKTRIGNAFFLNKNFQIENDYKYAITGNYAAKVESLNFGQAVKSAKIIDGYISNVTEGKIQNMVKADDVRGAFSLIVNAIYFTAKWNFIFNKGSNTKRNFFSSENNWKEIEFMNENRVTRLYAKDTDFEVLSLPYKDESYASNIFLPRRWFALRELKGTLNGTKIQRLLSQLRYNYMSVTIPKMKIESEYKIKETLMKIGIVNLFGDNADLSGISKSAPLYVSDVTHRAVIEVDEEGTTAAAATVLGLFGASANFDKVPSFVADHPFLFVLTKDRNPLFMGQFL